MPVNPKAAWNESNKKKIKKNISFSTMKLEVMYMI